MHSSAAHCGVDVFAAIARCATDLLSPSVVDYVPVAYFPADIDVGEQSSSGTIDIEFCVVACIASIRDREFDELFPVREKYVVNSLQYFCALRKSHRSQCWPADRTRVFQCCRKIDTSGARFCERLFSSGIQQSSGLAFTIMPFATDITLQFQHRSTLWFITRGRRTIRPVTPCNSVQTPASLVLNAQCC